MKASAAPIIRTFGFRRVLIVNVFLSTGFMAVNGFFTAATPHAIIFALLLVGGFLARSNSPRSTRWLTPTSRPRR